MRHSAEKVRQHVNVSANVSNSSRRNVRFKWNTWMERGMHGAIIIEQ